MVLVETLAESLESQPVRVVVATANLFEDDITLAVEFAVRNFRLEQNFRQTRQSFPQVGRGSRQEKVSVVVTGGRIGYAAAVFDNLIKNAGRDALAPLKNHVF